ncbi:MAG: hypothetical protein WCY48_07800 [Candidatus Caldatribacteriota bacterium]
MPHYVILLLFFLSSSALMAQDERYFRKMLSGDLVKKADIADGLPKFFVSADPYLMDLNGDGIEERIIPQKRDGVDWLEIQDSSHNVIFSAKLPSTGVHSHLFRIKMVALNSKVKTLILFLDEGYTHGGKFEAQGMIYLVSFENNDLTTLKLREGAKFFHEVHAQREQYYRRGYKVNVYDIDLDGDREIVVTYRHIQRIFKYAGHGDWKIM